jgi:DNA-binding NarL/FixJ family response regulator
MPGFVIVGPNHEEPDAFRLCRQVKQIWSSTRCLVYSDRVDDDILLADAAYVGVCAVLPTDADYEKTRQVRYRPIANRAVLSSMPQSEHMTNRELEVLSLLGQGTSETTRIRLVSDTPPHPAAQPVKPSLADAYLDLIRAERPDG